MMATSKKSLQGLVKRVLRENRRSYGAVPEGNKNFPSQRLISLESEFSAHNYHPVPVVFSQAKGSSVWDPEGNKYLDFLSAYSAVNQGHCHPKIVKALQDQVGRLTLSSRAFYNDKFPVFAERLTSMFGYDMVLPMNTGAEGVETALKLARKWGYEKKNIPKDEAIIVSCCGCFHGRTLAVISMSCDNEATRGFGPLLPGHVKVDFGNESALEKIFKEKGDKIAGFLFEPIQGEAGVIIPPDGYLKAIRELCSKYNVLMIADEIQTGLARTGRLLACDWEDVRPDVVILGKALGGGMIPVSVVLANKDVMLCIRPGEHGRSWMILSMVSEHLPRQPNTLSNFIMDAGKKEGLHQLIEIHKDLKRMVHQMRDLSQQMKKMGQSIHSSTIDQISTSQQSMKDDTTRDYLLGLIAIGQGVNWEFSQDKEEESAKPKAFLGMSERSSSKNDEESNPSKLDDTTLVDKKEQAVKNSVETFGPSQDSSWLKFVCFEKGGSFTGKTSHSSYLPYGIEQQTSSED